MINKELHLKVVKKFIDVVNDIPITLCKSKVRFALDTEGRLDIYIKFVDVDVELHAVTMLCSHETFYHHTMQTWNDIIFALAFWERDVVQKPIEDLFYLYLQDENAGVHRIYRDIREWYLYHKYPKEYYRHEYPSYFSDIGDEAGYQPDEEEIKTWMKQELEEQFAKPFRWDIY